MVELKISEGYTFMPQEDSKKMKSPIRLQKAKTQKPEKPP
jgi:hypothetical protein